MKMAMKAIRDKRGVTIVEFALISPVMIALICGAIEIGHQIFARAALDGAMLEAARVATASLETDETSRDTIMRASIRRSMAPFKMAPGQDLTIQTRVFRNFSTAYPENFTDVNSNGRYDLGEPYTDRNQNGQWDPAAQIAGTLGGPGDVVAYRAVFPKKILFSFLSGPLGLGSRLDITATTVVRNESVVRRSGT